jgi:nicotinate-nucleotide adenylyltransferase
VTEEIRGPVRLPPYAPGLRIGLLGGSFNPPHAAHRAISLLALRRLQLDQVWWLVTPGNPLKDVRTLPPLPERMAAAQAMARHPRITVTDIEAQISTRYSIDTIRYLLHRCPGVRFAWLMGADVLAEFHRWREWRAIFRTIPIAVVDRSSLGPRALAAPAAQAFQKTRLSEPRAPLLPTRSPPAWVFLHGLKLPVSSTALRHEKRTPGG